MISALRQLLDRRAWYAGQAYAEYGLIVMIIGVALIATLTLTGHAVFNLYQHTSTAMPR
jgi:Flp pilus assembly pilin Flp